MKHSIILFLFVPLLVVFSSAHSQAATPNRDQDPEQLWTIGWELSQDKIPHRTAVRAKGTRNVQGLHRRIACATPPRSDLLQELLALGVVRHANNADVVIKQFP
ncbi:MAG: hypothetical protein PHI31_11215 [Desulfuromonadaceae bacterium]|nr:hypothetical protein [Desulfuromonadaceae bacterium]